MGFTAIFKNPGDHPLILKKYFLSHVIVQKDKEFLKSIGQLFCRLPLNLGLSGCFHMIHFKLNITRNAMVEFTLVEVNLEHEKERFFSFSQLCTSVWFELL